MTKYDSDTTQEPSGRMESVRLPLVYFILPLCLSSPTPFFFFRFVIGTIAAMTDPIRPHWPELDWMYFVVQVILTIGFIGMYCRKEWALWLTVIVHILSSLWVIMIIVANSMGEPDPFMLLLYIYLAYEILIIIACFFALWQCSRFKKRIR